MKSCKMCGNEITDRESNNTKYCSLQCARKAKAECADAIADLIF